MSAVGSKTPLTDALAETFTMSRYVTRGDMYLEKAASMEEHARRLESALALAEGALTESFAYLRMRVSGTGGKGDTVILPKLSEALREIEKLKGGA